MATVAMERRTYCILRLLVMKLFQDVTVQIGRPTVPKNSKRVFERLVTDSFLSCHPRQIAFVFLYKLLL